MSTCSGCGALEECTVVAGAALCVAKSVAVTGGYSIDATEVTRDQYAAWLSKNPSTGGQPSYCSWNTSYAPSCEWPPGVKGEHPVVCVDWCDAYAYCAGVGKRLCGKIGGGANGYGDDADATKSQWFNACTSGGQNDYTYGDTYASATCNAGSTTVPVASMPGCQSSTTGYEGVYDLGGNVWEWEDSCVADSGTSELCRSRGGSFNPYGVGLRCDAGKLSARGHTGYDFGFRCCAP
jgi:formylglycine-generating enzyme required for sulfatase activity